MKKLMLLVYWLSQKKQAAAGWCGQPEDAASQEVKKIIAKLIADITVLVNRSLKKINTVAREHK